MAPEGGPIWSATEGQVVNWIAYSLSLLTFWLVLPLVWALFCFMRTSAHRYVVTNQRLRESTGLIFRRTEELELYRVKDISVEQPPMQRLFGCGRITLRTSDRSTPIVVLNAIPSPLVVADMLRDRIERCRVSKGVREID